METIIFEKKEKPSFKMDIWNNQPFKKFLYSQETTSIIMGNV